MGEEARTGRDWKWLIAGIAVAVVLVLGMGVGGGVLWSNHQHAVAAEAARTKAAQQRKALRDKRMGWLKDASECQTDEGLDSVKLQDSGTTVEYSQDYSYAVGWQCVESQLRVPSSIADEIESGNLFSGRQSDKWDGFKVTWTNTTYGFDAVFSLAD